MEVNGNSDVTVNLAGEYTTFQSEIGVPNSGVSSPVIFLIYGDGKQTRDFLYVGDLVEAILAADKTDTTGEVFQIASGRETSVLTLLKTMQEAIPDAKFDIRHEPARAGEIIRNYASVDKARRMLGYDPKTRLEDGLRTTWQWFLSKSRKAASK